jgi:hypothetical protein
VYDLYTKKCQKRGREVGEGKKARGSRAVGTEGAGGQSPQDSSPLVIIILTDFFFDRNVPPKISFPFP